VRLGPRQRDVAGRDMAPQRLDLGARPDRRIDLGLAADTSDVGFLVENCGGSLVRRLQHRLGFGYDAEQGNAEQVEHVTHAQHLALLH